MKYLFILIPLLFYGCGSEDLSREEIIFIFTEYEKGNLKTDSPTAKGGVLAGPNNEEYSRSVLIEKSQVLIAGAKDNVPLLITYTSHEYPYIRFIAAYSLKKITNSKNNFYYYGVPGKPFGGEKNWYEKCVIEWNSWYIHHIKNASNN